MEEWLLSGAINPYFAGLQECNKAAAEAEKLYIRICNSTKYYLNLQIILKKQL